MNHNGWYVDRIKTHIDEQYKSGMICNDELALFRAGCILGDLRKRFPQLRIHLEDINNRSMNIDIGDNEFVKFINVRIAYDGECVLVYNRRLKGQKKTYSEFLDHIQQNYL